MAVVAVKLPAFVKDATGKMIAGVKDGYLALMDWPAYTDNDGKTHEATLRVVKFQSASHLSQCVSEDGKVRDGKMTGQFKPQSISREDLALYSGAWDALIAEAKKQDTMK